MTKSSRISGFYNLSPAERQHIVADWGAMSPEQSVAVQKLLDVAGRFGVGTGR